MLVIEVELLTGRYAATAHDDRRRAEWPPHPARFFSALVAALHDHDPPDATEREVLLWLEKQDPPAIDVDIAVGQQLGQRDVHDVWVPVNDITVAGELEKLMRELDDAQRNLAAARQASEAGLARRQIEKVNAALRRAASAPQKTSKVSVEAAAALLPQRRVRQLRTFPVIVPARSRFSFVWRASPAPELESALDALCARVTRLGHSSSLVRCARVQYATAPSLVPDGDGDLVLRVVGPGQLTRLEREFEWHRAEKSRVLPALPQRYATPSTAGKAARPPQSAFSQDWIIFERCGGARLPSSRAPDLARALRAALLEAHDDAPPLPPVLSGHEADGRPAAAPHLAFVACPAVGHLHADGGVLGCAIVLPRALSPEDRRTLMRLIAKWEHSRAKDGIVELAGRGFPPVRLERVATSARRALQPSRWCRPSRHFITATPIALDRHPGELASRSSSAATKAALQAQRSVADACERIGLPRPVEVQIALAPLLEGGQPTRAFGTWPKREGSPARARVHARIEFDQPVRGPVLLGAGRFFGLGMCLPVHQDGTAS